MVRDPGLSPTRDILEDAPCGVVVMDPDGRILAVNDTLSGWLGTPVAELRNGPATAIFSLASRVIFETSLFPMLDLQQEVSGVSLDIIDHAGAQIPVMMSAGNRGEGRDRVVLLVLLKAGARRDFERDMLKARADAEARLTVEKRQGELREQFVAVLGHDLRNPVASMSSAIRMLWREPDPEHRAEILRLMRGSVQRMARLIDNVLDFTRDRLGGGIELDLQSGELEPAIQQAIDELRAAEPDRDVQVTLSIGHPVACDAWRIGQMVSNLVGNALTHGDPAYPIYVDAASYAGGALEIRVSNRGVPISQAALDQLFEPFGSGGGAGTRKGLGLGLYIAAEIARAHDGWLDVRSDDETCFTFRMPGEGGPVERDAGPGPHSAG